MKNGDKQIVVLGESNENNVVVEKGLDAGALIYLSTPAEPERFKLVGEDLITIIKDREKAKKAEELRLREEAEKAKNDRGGGMMTGGGMNITPEMMQRFQNSRGSGGVPGQGGPRDTAAMRRMMNMRGAGGNQGAPRDTAAMRRMMNMRNRQQGQQQQQQGTVRDTSSRRRTSAPGQASNRN
jgi:hypothetical protein